MCFCHARAQKPKRQAQKLCWRCGVNKWNRPEDWLYMCSLVSSTVPTFVPDRAYDCVSVSPIRLMQQSLDAPAMLPHMKRYLWDDWRHHNRSSNYNNSRACIAEAPHTMPAFARRGTCPCHHHLGTGRPLSSDTCAFLAESGKHTVSL